MGPLYPVTRRMSLRDIVVSGLSGDIADYQKVVSGNRGCMRIAWVVMGQVDKKGLPRYWKLVNTELVSGSETNKG